MWIEDHVYGRFEQPELVEALSHTDLCARLRRLTQDGLPNSLITHGPAPSRFDHGLGVAHLADIATQYNPSLVEYRAELLAAALLHDAGNPPCSHLLETLLADSRGYRAEKHLTDLMYGSETERVLRRFGVNIDLVLRLVAGTAEPLSLILNGSMDLDNVDNVARYRRYIGGVAVTYNPEAFARLISFTAEGCYLRPGGEAFISQWREERRRVYELVNEPERSVARRMVYRAAELVYASGNLPSSFFRMHDEQAIDFLRTQDFVPGARFLAEAAVNWSWYIRAVDYTASESVPDTLVQSSKDWKKKKELADALAARYAVGSEQVCVAAGWGKYDRQVTLPVETPTGEFVLDANPAKDFFHFRVWFHPQVQVEPTALYAYIEQYLGLTSGLLSTSQFS